MRTLKDSYEYRGIALKHKKAECERCKSTENLEIDHIDENRNNNIPDNLRILCHDCHLKRHGIREKTKYPKKFQSGTRHNNRK